MAQEAQPIDVQTLPDMTRLAREVNETGKARLIQVGGDVVRLSPARPRAPLPRKRPTPDDIQAALAAAGSWKGLVDAEQLKRDLDDARSSDARPLDITV
jgi:hypothetical protein